MGVHEREATENLGNQKIEDTDLLELAWSGWRQATDSHHASHAICCLGVFFSMSGASGDASVLTSIKIVECNGLISVF